MKAIVKNFMKNNINEEIQIYYENAVMRIPDNIFLNHDYTFWALMAIGYVIIFISCIGLCVMCRKYKKKRVYSNP